MAAYLIVYEPEIPGQTCKALNDAIESLGECSHPFNSLWILSNPKDIKDDLTLRNKLMALIGKQDKLCVVDCTNRPLYSIAVGQTHHAWADRVFSNNN